MNSTHIEILNLLSNKKEMTVDLLHKEIGVSKSMIHRALKKLVAEEQVAKYGSPPRVYYALSGTNIELKTPGHISQDVIDVINKNFLFSDTKGQIYNGIEGFNLWLQSTNQQNQPGIYPEYAKSIVELDQFRSKEGYIDATDRITSIMDTQLSLEKVFYSDFYSIPKFGKTKLGKLVLFAKESQSRKLVKQVADLTSQTILNIIQTYNIDAVAYLPHSIPRNTQFLKEFADLLRLKLPHIVLDKAYPGEVIIAQKGLSKLHDRINNARETIFVRDTTQKFAKVLLIDDAVGSGATLNETAQKLLNNGVADQVYGYGVVGSYKGFDVLPRV